MRYAPKKFVVKDLGSLPSPVRSAQSRAFAGTGSGGLENAVARRNKMLRFGRGSSLLGKPSSGPVATHYPPGTFHPDHTFARAKKSGC